MSTGSQPKHFLTDPPPWLLSPSLQINTDDSLWRLFLNIPTPVYPKVDSDCSRPMGAGTLPRTSSGKSTPRRTWDPGSHCPKSEAGTRTNLSCWPPLPRRHTFLTRTLPWPGEVWAVSAASVCQHMGSYLNNQGKSQNPNNKLSKSEEKLYNHSCGFYEQRFQRQIPVSTIY